MHPTRDTHATLVDLLDRVLEKGLVLNADLIIHVAGIPLLGVSLKACIAGIETMLEYGMWQDWDEAQRSAAAVEYQKGEDLALTPGEEILLKTFAYQRCHQGIYCEWRPGYLYVTDKRVFLFRKRPAEVLFQCFHEEIREVDVAQQRNTIGNRGQTLQLRLDPGYLAEFRLSDALTIKNAIDNLIGTPEIEPAVSLRPQLDMVGHT